MKLRHMTAEVVELENVVIEERRNGETIYHCYDRVKSVEVARYHSCDGDFR